MVAAAVSDGPVRTRRSCWRGRTSQMRLELCQFDELQERDSVMGNLQFPRLPVLKNSIADFRRKFGIIFNIATVYERPRVKVLKKDAKIAALYPAIRQL